MYSGYSISEIQNVINAFIEFDVLVKVRIINAFSPLLPDSRDYARSHPVIIVNQYNY